MDPSETHTPHNPADSAAAGPAPMPEPPTGGLDSRVARALRRLALATRRSLAQSAETAEAFMGSDDLRDAMARAGVVSAPNIWLTDEA